MNKWKTGAVMGILAEGIGITVYEMSLLAADDFENGHSNLYILFSMLAAFLLAWFLVQLHDIKPVKRDVKAAVRIRLGLYGSLGMNLLFACMQLWLGLINRSLWFICCFAFYLVLAMVRLVLASQIRTDLGSNLAEEYWWSRLCGIGLMVLNAVFSLIVFSVAHRQQGFTYPVWITVCLTGYTGYLVVASLVNLFKFRRCGSPVLYALMLVNFIFSLTAVLTFETAVMADCEVPELRQAITGMTGAFICSIIWIIAFFLVLDANAALKILDKEQETKLELETESGGQT